MKSADVFQHPAVIGVVAQLVGARSSKRQGEWMAICPFHQDSRPSFSVVQKADGGVVGYCRACNWNGGALAIIMGVNHLAKDDAVRWLYEQVGLPYRPAARSGGLTTITAEPRQRPPVEPATEPERPAVREWGKEVAEYRLKCRKMLNLRHCQRRDEAAALKEELRAQLRVSGWSVRQWMHLRKQFPYRYGSVGKLRVVYPEWLRPDGPPMKPPEHIERVLVAARDVFAEQGRRPLARDYCADRGITPETQEAFAIGYCPPGATVIDALMDRGCDLSDIRLAGILGDRIERGIVECRWGNRLTFPISVGETIVGFAGRSLGDTQFMKYVNSPKAEWFIKGELVYGHPGWVEAAKAEQRLFVVEGYADVWQAYAHGIHNVVAMMGTAMTDRQVRFLATRVVDCQVVMAMDRDRAGILAVAQSFERFVANGLWPTWMWWDYPDKDIDELLRKRGRDVFLRAADQALPVWGQWVGYLQTLPEDRRHEVVNALILRIQDPEVCDTLHTAVTEGLHGTPRLGVGGLRLKQLA